jgi:aspartate aminotransferase
MPISRKMTAQIANSSWIRQMFEEGARLKAQFGEDAVCDFTLGNPNAAPPPGFFAALREMGTADDPAAHRYMTSAGFPDARRAVADVLSREHGVALTEKHVLMSCGAAGGMNVIMKVLLDPGDEVLVFAPYFPEYLAYADNHGGRVGVVETDDLFQPDADRLAAAVTPRTKAVILNSPNNPTGAVYPQAAVAAIGRVLADAERRLGRPIFLVADEPYRHIVYDETPVPSPFGVHANAIVVSSFSKDLGVPGERIGYIALSPSLADLDLVFSACATATRTLGFVNAPALMQRVVARCLGGDGRFPDEPRHAEDGSAGASPSRQQDGSAGASPSRAALASSPWADLSLYRRNRDVLCEALRRGGFAVDPPPGAFYLFPRCPDGDDLAWCTRLREQRILTVPGRGFGRAGHLRLATCADAATVDRALPILAKLRQV